MITLALVMSAGRVTAAEVDDGNPPPAAAGEDAVVIGVTGDFGWNHPSHLEDHGELVKSLDPDFVVTTGDNVQTTIREGGVPGGAPLTGTDIYDFVVGRKFCDYMEGSAPGPQCTTGGNAEANTFFPAAGNHDYNVGDGGGPIQNYLDYFDLPGVGATSNSPSGSELYYDVQMGPVHLFVLDSDAMFQELVAGADPADIGYPGSPSDLQRQWLEDALDDSDAPWKVVALHHTPYSSAPPQPSSGYGSNDWLQWPFDELGADLVLAGHHHAYERLEVDGVHYVVNGMGGDVRPFGDPVDGSEKRFNEPDTLVVGRLAATETSLSFEAHSSDGEVVDRLDLGSDPPPTAVASGAPTSGTAPLEVVLNGEGSSDPLEEALTYSWDTDGDGTFGDATGISPTVVYEEPGTYMARLEVTTADERTALSNAVPITVTAPTGPENVTPPAISGSAEVGATLTATPGDWDGTDPVETAIQWQRCLPLSDGGYADVVSSDGPLAYSRLGEPDGTTASDASGNGADATYLNGVLLGVDGALDDDTAVSFDGADDRVELSGMALSGTELTAELWLRTTSTAPAGIASYAVENSSDEFHLTSPGALVVSVIGTRVETNTAVNDGEWHHVAVTWSSSDGVVELHVDGNLEHSANDVRTGHALTGGGTLVLGQEQDEVGGGFEPSQAFDGDLDEVAFHATRLDEARVEARVAAADGYECNDIAGATGLQYVLQPDDEGATIRLRVTAQDLHGTTSEHSAAAGPVTPGEVAVPPELGDDPIGTFDLAESPGAHRVRVSGWTADPNTPDLPTAVHVYIGGPAGSPGTQGFSIQANQPRPDVVALHPYFAEERGFDQTLSTTKGGQQPVCAYAINRGAGKNKALGCRTVTIANPKPFGSYDSLASPSKGKVRVTGWIIDRSAPTTPVRARIVIGGTKGTPGTESRLVLADRRRTDLDRIYPGVGPDHGLDATVDTSKSGEQTVCLYAQDIGGGPERLLGCKKTNIVK